VANLAGWGKHIVASRRGNIDNGLPPVAVGSQAIKGSVETEHSESDRAGGGDGHPVTRLRRNGNQTTVQIHAVVAGGTDAERPAQGRVVDGTV
jgi:hypothetical protein